MIYSQEKSAQEKTVQEQPKSRPPQKQIPVQAQYSNDFTVREIWFNRVIEKGGKGELLEVQFEVKNNTDYPLDLYIFVLASYVEKEKTDSSFERPVPKQKRIRSFVPYPLDIENFKYPVQDAKGDTVKNRHGREVFDYFEFPHDPKAGISPDTGKPYHIKEKLHVRTYHLSQYRVNYFFFNRVAILAFDKDGNPVYRQLYELKGFRR